MQLSGISCGEEAHEGTRDVSASTAGSQCKEPEKPSGQSEYDALRMQILKNSFKFADDDRENCYRQEVQHLAV